MEKVNFDYDQKSNALFLSYDSGFILNNVEDIEILFATIQERITKIGHRVVLISNLTNFRMKLDRQVLELWKQRVVKITKGPLIYGWIRYNTTDLDAQTGINLRVAQMQLDSPLYIFANSREEAITRATELIANRRKKYPSLPYPEPLS